MRYLICILFIFSAHHVLAGSANMGTNNCSPVCATYNNNCGSYSNQPDFYGPGTGPNSSYGYLCNQPPCPSGQNPQNGQCMCPDGQPSDAFGSCPPPICSEGEYNHPENGNCIPEPCDGGGFWCCDTTNPPDACENPPPCNELTDPECAPDPDPECGENEYWDGTTCVSQTSSSPSTTDNSSSGDQSSQSDTGGDSSDGNNSGGDSSDSDNSGGTNSSAGYGSGEGSNSSQGPANSVSGGGTCDAPPVCDGDPIMCANLQQNWEIRCAGPEGEQEKGVFDFSQLQQLRQDSESELNTLITDIQNDLTQTFNFDFSGNGGSIQNDVIDTRWGEMVIGVSDHQQHFSFVGNVLLFCAYFSALVIILRR